MKLERIDLYQLHAIDDDVPLEDSVSIAHLEEDTAAQEIVFTEAEFEALDRAY